MPDAIFPIIIASASTAAAASLLGTFVILQRLALAADVFSHIALPGLALAFAFHINPFLGGFLFLFLAAIVVWQLERKTSLPLDALIGIFFSASLALGALFFKEKEELLEALFGNLNKVTATDAFIAVLSGVILFAVVLASLRSFTLALLSPDLAASLNVRVVRLRLVFLLMMALVVALGIKIVGVLLVGALLILPAIAAQNISRGLRQALWLSVVVGMIGTLLGLAIAILGNLEAGPVIVLTLTGGTIISFVTRRG